jgi:hypothetical protein
MVVGFATETVSITYGRLGDFPGVSATEVGADILQADSAPMERFWANGGMCAAKGGATL